MKRHLDVQAILHLALLARADLEHAVLVDDELGHVVKAHAELA